MNSKNIDKKKNNNKFTNYILDYNNKLNNFTIPKNKKINSVLSTKTKTKNMKKNLDLYDIFNTSYNNPLNNNITNNTNYKIDKNLSNEHQQVYVNNKDKKIIFNVRGTKLNDINDLKADASLLLFNNVKNSNRFQEAQNTYNNAKNKYSNYKFTDTGYSLGGQIINNLNNNKNDKIITYNGYVRPFEKANKNAVNYRTNNDIISYFAKNRENTINLNNTSNKPHSLDSIKRLNIKVS